MKTFQQLLLAPIAALLALSSTDLTAEDFRQWSDSSGAYQVTARLMTADENLVVLERKDGELIGVTPSQLSKADQKLIKKSLAERRENDSATDTKWQLDDGEVVVGRLMGFGRQELEVKRERGKLLVNDRQLDELPPAYRKILPNVVSVVDETKIDDLEDLESHLADLGGGPFEYVVEGVQLDLRQPGLVTIPLAMLTTEEAKAITPGFNRWKASQEKSVSEEDRYEAESRERLALESRYRMQQRRQPWRQFRLMELGLLAVEAGVTDLWEVAILPPNRYGYRRSVVVAAPNSLLASQKVARQYPGWRIGAVARRSN